MGLRWWVMTFSCVRGASPALYFHDIRRSVASVEGRAMPRWTKLRTHQGKRYGPRVFHVAAPAAWNNLPKHFRTDDISRGLLIRELNTLMFSPTRQRHRWEGSFKRRFINKSAYLHTYVLHLFVLILQMHNNREDDFKLNRWRKLTVSLQPHDQTLGSSA